ncbi:MAG: hypothetical protein GX568_05685 [Candidatus Gastranaerophilales bacterium]|nr:hypothetical protein [Candidatus Gastranaerophilales bacterium]
MGNLQEKTFHTKQSVSKNQYSTIGEIRFMTREKVGMNIEKNFPADKMFADSASTGSFNIPDSPAQLVMKNDEKDALKNTTNPLLQEADKNHVISAVMSAKTCIVNEISTIFDKKLEKLDNAVMELIDCKTENERLKSKIDNLIKENYKLKKELLSYKPLMPGVFIKSKKDEFIL